MTTMLQTHKISDIKEGNRHRKDMGDLTSLVGPVRRMPMRLRIAAKQP